ncbi:LCP family protein [Aquibacillus salsiterrae]|uniref:LCP family protein n=1 Tax=Aquibacillus salsiterrae TaxID=2950439 RepID=A0A9X4AE21_9BACI|nr:LCP family protein [Aquibacillus salsiterrae]MDC3415974.1 LCP family protein [Aquibacillus salsiterrae]
MKPTNYNNKSRVQKRKAKHKTRKRIFWILVPLLFLAGATSVYGAYIYNKAADAADGSYNPLERDKVDQENSSDEKKSDKSKENVSILFIGVDASKKRGTNGNALSDALILATLNREDKSVKMLSIPRDSYVYIPEVGYKDKITHAHAYGGPQATIETVEQLFDIPIDYYVKMNFNAFIDVVDALDGITVDVQKEVWEQNSKDVKNAIHLLPGEQELNGEEALALARTRKMDNDIQRGLRQQQILKAIIDKGTSLGSIFKIDNVIDAVGNNMETNMKFSEMKNLASYGAKGKIDIESFTLKGYDYWPEDVYYYQLDEEDLAEKKQMLQSHLQLDNQQTESSTE